MQPNLKLLLFFSLFFWDSNVLAQKQEKFDIISYSAPVNWTKDVKDGVVIYTDIKKNTGGYCVIAIYASTASTGDPLKDFHQEWNELVVTVFKAAENPATETATTKDGWKLVSGAAAIKTEEADAYIILAVYSGFGKTASILANTNDLSYAAKLDTLLDGIKLDKIKKTQLPASSTKTGINAAIIGKWARAASSPPQYNNGVLVNLTDAGYHKGQYNFKNDGTYSFKGEARYGNNTYHLIEESGRFSTQNDQLKLSPQKNKLILVDYNGKLKRTEKFSLQSRTYQWQLHYFEGIKETNLVLSGEKENITDGGYGGNTLFPNAFLYSREFIPEWRF